MIIELFFFAVATGEVVVHWGGPIAAATLLYATGRKLHRRAKQKREAT